MTQDFLEYPKLMERAMRGVVREALTLVARHGLPGLHHFYISFKTGAPGVAVPDHLAAQYPDEMTIVLEHQFWDLEVGEDGFAVGLSFNGVRQRLRVPFAAVTAFVDPSVKFGLQFGEAALGPLGAAEEGAAPDPAGAAETDAAAADGGAGDGAGDERVVALDRFRKK